MSKIIAVVRLAPGQVAFYDEKTGTHLTIGNPMGEIQEHMKIDGIKRAVANKTLTLVHGGFTETSEVAKAVQIEPKVEAPKVEVVEPVIEKEVEPVVEQVETEEVVEEVVEAAPKAKATRKKK